MKRNRPLRFSVSIGVFSFTAAVSWLHAQPAANRVPPHIGFVYPAGGQRGTTFVVSVGGQNLVGASGVYFSVPGIAARIIDYERPLTQKEFTALRDELQALQEKRGSRDVRGDQADRPGAAKRKNDADKPRDPERNAVVAGSEKPMGLFTETDAARMLEIRQILARRGNRQASVAIAEMVTLEIALPPETASGDCELRLRAASGLSNPVAFRIGELPEVTLPVATAMSRPAERKKPETIAVEPARRVERETAIRLPVVANGQILPGEVRRFRFEARKGQRIVARVEGRSLLPYLADAVPGWFQPTLAIYDRAGRELAYQDDCGFRPDPTLPFEIPSDGGYIVELKDALYRGREDFVYRLTIGELPVVASAVPAACAVGTLPPALEQERNDSIAEAESVSLPRMIDGRIDRPGDIDVYAFAGKAGTEFVAEVIARRLGSPLDSKLTLLDATGRVLAKNDDYDDKAAGLLTHQSDSRVSLRLPADGAFYAKIEDAQRHGGPEYSYRLRLSPPRPDFGLRLVPSSVNLRAGGTVPITIYALRQDGFDGEIRLALEHAMPGLVLSGARIPSGQDKIQATLTAPASGGEEPFNLEMSGTAVVVGQSVKRIAVPAEDMMQAFAYHHLVTAAQGLTTIAGRGAAFRVLTRPPVALTPNEKSHVRVAVPGARALENLEVELNQPPDGLIVAATEFRDGVLDVALACDAAKLKTGTEGNLVFTATAERRNPNDKNAKGRGQRIPIGCVPAIPFKVTDSSAAVR